jgi:hypothetical protein
MNQHLFATLTQQYKYFIIAFRFGNSSLSINKLSQQRKNKKSKRKKKRLRRQKERIIGIAAQSPKSMTCFTKFICYLKQYITRRNQRGPLTTKDLYWHWKQQMPYSIMMNIMTRTNSQTGFSIRSTRTFSKMRQKGHNKLVKSWQAIHVHSYQICFKANCKTLLLVWRVKNKQTEKKTSSILVLMSNETLH